MRRVWAAIFGGVTAASLLVMTACASEGDVEGSGLPGSSTSSSSSSSGSAERPGFDASFGSSGGQDANVDPTPEGGGDTCVDPDDPGSAENVAKPLTDTTDCDNNDKQVKGVMNGAVDVDFYKVSGTDKFGCSLDTHFKSATSGVELCVYARCKNSTADAVTGCNSGSVADTSSTGMKGCCVNAPGEATPQWDCSGITDNDSADFVIRVRQSVTSTDQCLAYSFTYQF